MIIEIGKLYKMKMDYKKYSFVVVTELVESRQWKTSAVTVELDKPESPFLVPLYVAEQLWEQVEENYEHSENSYQTGECVRVL